jgi:hypothetical protein
MTQKKFSDLELQLASEHALYFMQTVSGVKDVAVIPGRYNIEPLMNGNGFVAAGITKVFVDRNIDKNSENFVAGQDLYDSYHRHCDGNSEKKELIDCNWQIIFQKIGGFFKDSYVGESLLCLGTKTWQIGFVEEASSLESLFKTLSAQADRLQPHNEKKSDKQQEFFTATPDVPIEDTIAFKAAIKFRRTEKKVQQIYSKLSGEDSYPCPICAETIKKAAKKCIHCGEWIEDSKHKGPWGQ